jgi:hypothetical protein
MSIFFAAIWQPLAGLIISYLSLILSFIGVFFLGVGLMALISQ